MSKSFNVSCVRLLRKENELLYSESCILLVIPNVAYITLCYNHFMYRLQTDRYHSEYKMPANI